MYTTNRTTATVGTGVTISEDVSGDDTRTAETGTVKIHASDKSVFLKAGMGS